MSITISTISCQKLWRNYPHASPRIPKLPLVTCQIQNLQFPSYPPKNLVQRFRFQGVKLRFCLKAGNEEDRKGISDAEKEEKELEELRGKSTMPDRFKYLAKEAPSPPLRWPWLLALAFLVYAWRSVLWELANWKKVIEGMFHFVGYLSKLALAIIFHFAGDPITHSIFYIETAFNAIRDFYFSIVTSAPIPELTTILILASTVLAIGEAASPNSVNSQSYILTVASFIGYGAVRGIIIEPFFWLLLLGIFSFSRIIKKRDYVSSALPVVAVLASVGEPWIRVLTILLFTALAIHHHSQKLADGEESEVMTSSVKIPFPLLGVALAIGIRVAAKWAGYRHLTWMIT
ncbi:uncharacterized protein LOC141647777 isoform X1 [Silene latifolia]|uniref:uncharacterized protein LOC141647777 isoform X1 n=1 Tax=Silene latifolia TaxID=37657 RepID=UPI003D77A69D